MLYRSVMSNKEHNLVCQVRKRLWLVFIPPHPLLKGYFCHSFNLGSLQDLQFENNSQGLNIRIPKKLDPTFPIMQLNSISNSMPQFIKQGLC